MIRLFIVTFCFHVRIRGFVIIFVAGFIRLIGGFMFEFGRDFEVRGEEIEFGLRRCMGCLGCMLGGGFRVVVIVISMRLVKFGSRRIRILVYYSPKFSVAFLFIS